MVAENLQSLVNVLTRLGARACGYIKTIVLVKYDLPGTLYPRLYPRNTLRRELRGLGVVQNGTPVVDSLPPLLALELVVVHYALIQQRRWLPSGGNSGSGQEADQAMDEMEEFAQSVIDSKAKRDHFLLEITSCFKNRKGVEWRIDLYAEAWIPEHAEHLKTMPRRFKRRAGAENQQRVYRLHRICFAIEQALVEGKRKRKSSHWQVKDVASEGHQTTVTVGMKSL